MLRSQLSRYVAIVLFASSIGVSAHSQTDAKAEEKFWIKILNIVSGTNCNEDKAAPINVPPPPPPPPQPSTEKAKPTTNLKGEGELRRYLECYSPTDAVYDKIDKKYLPIIESASRAFGLPRSLVACLIFAESKFDPRAESSTGAFGLGQHTGGTGAHITNIIKVRDAKVRANDLEMANSTPEELSEKRKTTVRQAREDIRVAKIKVMNDGFAEKWDVYYDDLKRRGLYKVKAANPHVVNDKTLLDPTIAIGASALYLHMMMTHVKMTLDSDIIVGTRTDWNVEVLLTSAGMYNMGPGAGQYVLGRIDPPDRKAWVEALMKSNEETAKYLITIRNCVTSGASGTQQAYLPPMLTPQYSCETGDKPRVALGDPLKLPKQYENVIKHARDVMSKKVRKTKSDSDDGDSKKNEKKKVAEPKSAKKKG